MRRAYKFRLYPNRNQERELEIMLETHRRLYNACLGQRKSVYEKDQISVSYCEQSAWYKNQRAVHPWYAKLNFSSAQATMRRLDKAYAAFFRRLQAGEKPGYPRFKVAGRYDSMEFPAYGDGIRLQEKLRIQHVGQVKVKRHRGMEGAIKTVTLKREADKWYAIFSCDLGDVSIASSTNPPVGIDVGIESFFTTSEGEHEPNPAYLKAQLPALRRAGRVVTRKQKGGQNRRKAVGVLRAWHVRVKNLRGEHRHQVALKLCRRYGLIAVESLNIKGMLRNRRLSRAIADAAWGGFLATLRCKAERAGVVVVEVNARGTSQRCSNCGQVVEKSLRQRQHVCSCGLAVHRDVNAARNILALARTGPAEPNVGVNSHVLRSRHL